MKEPQVRALGELVERMQVHRHFPLASEFRPAICVFLLVDVSLRLQSSALLWRVALEQNEAQDKTLICGAVHIQIKVPQVKQKSNRE